LDVYWKFEITLDIRYYIDCRQYKEKDDFGWELREELKDNFIPLFSKFKIYSTQYKISIA